MADTKISALTEATTVAAADELALVQSGTTKRVGVDTLFSSANVTWQGWVFPYSTGWVGTAGLPLTSTSWDGDARSTEAKTKIDLSAVFGAPANIKAISVRIAARDSASVNTSAVYFGVSPNNTADSFAVDVSPRGLVNDYYANAHGVCPCDANGDIYYQVAASGAGTLDAVLQIWGYLL